MKKISITFFAFILAAVSQSQITINSQHLPNASDTLRPVNCTLLGNFDANDTGENHVWNYQDDVLQVIGAGQAVTCYDLNDLSFFDQLVFNNPFYAEYDSDFGQGIEAIDLTVVTLEDAYMIYKNSGNVYAATGMIATINGLPAIGQMVDRDIIYDLPLTYGGSGNSNSAIEFDIPTIGYYKLNQTREYSCDGWGSLNILGETFDVIRIRSVVNATDSIYTEAFGTPIGFSFPRPEVITYEWRSTEFNIPVLKITENGIIPTVEIADFLNLRMAEAEAQQMTVYPNPASNEIRIQGVRIGSEMQLTDASGRILRSWKYTCNDAIPVADLPAGNYLLRSSDGQSETFIRL